MSKVINLAPLFEAQKELDARIIREKGLEGQDLLPNTILALQVELGELANEWRGFKHWSNDREPRTSGDLREALPDEPADWVFCVNCGNGCDDGTEECVHCQNTEFHRYNRINPMLEEFVDCLSFILSLGLQMSVEITAADELDIIYKRDVTKQFIRVIHNAGEMLRHNAGHNNWWVLAESFNGLGKALGFTWEQITAAYYAKNKINHDRQASGY